MDPYALVLFYSRSGKVKSLANHIAQGIEAGNLIAKVRTVPPVSPTNEATTPKVPDSGAPYVTLEEFKNCSALAMGSPSRFANMAAPLKYFLESTSAIWAAGNMVGKPASVFTSSDSMHGGQESTLISMMLPLLHHGAIIVGPPYATITELHTTTTGGTPYGPSHVGGLKGSNNISKEEQEICFKLGKHLATVALKLL